MAYQPHDTMSKILTFLDTNVLISAMCGSGTLADRCFEVIDDPNREFVASDFLKLELLPKPIYNKQKECAEFYNEYICSASKMLGTSSATTANAFELASQYGLGPVDAIHFQTAIEADVAEFITIEKPTKPFFKINHPSVKAISLRESPSAKE